jgi:site-specific recombinase
MDLLSVSASVVGFLSLALEISRILKTYTSDVKSAPEEAHSLLTEVGTLCQVLDQVVRFLRKDFKAHFEASTLVLSINACRNQIEELYKRLEKLETPDTSNNKVKGFIERMKWPLRKEDYQATLGNIHRFTHTFHFSLTISNWLVLIFLCSTD